jgi:hypothetical protein
MAAVIDLPRPPGHRRFYAMVAVSLGLHGALLWGIGEPDKRSGNLLPALQATLRIPAISAAQTLPAPVVPETVAPTPRALRAGQSSSNVWHCPLLLGASHLRPSRLRMFRTSR